MLGIRPGRRGCIRLLLISLVSITLSIFYWFLKSRPPDKLYEALFIAEEENSVDLLEKHREGNLRFVKFRQLQGAGFNNQVRSIYFLCKNSQCLMQA